MAGRRNEGRGGRVVMEGVEGEGGVEAVFVHKGHATDRRKVPRS